MRIVRTETLISAGDFPHSAQWKRISRDLRAGIAGVKWPPGSDRFTIYPESGKGRGQGNGVKPIKAEMMAILRRRGWRLEEPLDIATARTPGKLDAVLNTRLGPFAVEWETGNISSSHRALNKMALGMLKAKLAGGALVVPSRKLYKYLTDRVGNFAELEPYLDFWKAIPCRDGLLQIVVVEHDGTSTDVPRILKGTNGRALA
jgi:hypothetical protein